MGLILVAAVERGSMRNNEYSVCVDFSVITVILLYIRRVCFHFVILRLPVGSMESDVAHAVPDSKSWFLAYNCRFFLVGTQN